MLKQSIEGRPNTSDPVYHCGCTTLAYNRLLIAEPHFVYVWANKNQKYFSDVTLSPPFWMLHHSEAQPLEWPTEAPGAGWWQKLPWPVTSSGSELLLPQHALGPSLFFRSSSTSKQLLIAISPLTLCPANVQQGPIVCLSKCHAWNNARTNDIVCDLMDTVTNLNPAVFCASFYPNFMSRLLPQLSKRDVYGGSKRKCPF